MSNANHEAPEGPRDDHSFRYATRYEPSRREACLSWRESDDRIEAKPIDPQSRRQFALLLDISQAGASVALDRIPRPDRGVWLRLEGDSLTDWAEAEVVGVTTTIRGPHLVRLAFLAPCPFETLRAAICG